MVAASIEQLKRDYTDKYVKVDGDRPELARFRDIVGQVKTVNMSGRALVEFVDYHLNIGWYDIDLSFLTVVDKPTEEQCAAAKATPEKPAAAPVAKAEKPAAAKPVGAKLSVAEMMAAARGGGGAKPATPAAPKAKAADTAAAKPAPAAAKPAGGKMSVADMIAAARKVGAEAATAPAPAAEVEAAAEEPVVAATPKSAAKAAPGGKVDRSKMSVANMIAYCREHDVS